MKIHGIFSRSEKDPSSLDMRSLIATLLFDLVFGLLLILLRDQALSIAEYVLAGLLLAVGVYEGIIYLRSPVIRRITEARLAAALVLLLSSILLFFNHGFLSDFFPVLWGLTLLTGAFLKIQYAFDLLSLKKTRWWLMLVFAGFSLAIGIIALLRPGFLGENTELIIGIMMIVESVLNLAVYIIISRALKKGSAPSHSMEIREDPSPAAAQEKTEAPAPAAPETAAAPETPAPAAPEASAPSAPSDDPKPV